MSWFTRDPFTGALSYWPRDGYQLHPDRGRSWQNHYGDRQLYRRRFLRAQCQFGRSTSLVHSVNSYPTDLNVSAPLTFTPRISPSAQSWVNSMPPIRMPVRHSDLPLGERGRGWKQFPFHPRHQRYTPTSHSFRLRNQCVDLYHPRTGTR